MAWKPLKMTEALEQGVMSVYAADYEHHKSKNPRPGDPSFEEWLGWHDVRPKTQWTAAENSLKAGRVVTVHGVAEQTSFLFVYDPSGKLVGSFSEHHGEDRGPNRRKRVTSLLGEAGARLLGLLLALCLLVGCGESRRGGAGALSETPEPLSTVTVQGVDFILPAFVSPDDEARVVDSLGEYLDDALLGGYDPSGLVVRVSVGGPPTYSPATREAHLPWRTGTKSLPITVRPFTKLHWIIVQDRTTTLGVSSFTDTQTIVRGEVLPVVFAPLHPESYTSVEGPVNP